MPKAWRTPRVAYVTSRKPRLKQRPWGRHMLWDSGFMLNLSMSWLIHRNLYTSKHSQLLHSLKVSNTVSLWWAGFIDMSHVRMKSFQCWRIVHVFHGKLSLGPCAPASKIRVYEASLRLELNSMRCSLEVAGNVCPAFVSLRMVTYKKMCIFPFRLRVEEFKMIIDLSTAVDEYNPATFNRCQNSKNPHNVSRVWITRSVGGLSDI